MVPAAPWVFRIAMSNCPGMQGIGGVAVGVGVGSGVAVGDGTGVAVGETSETGPPLDAGVEDPHAASVLTAATSTVETRTGRIATQGTRNPRSTRIRYWWGCPGPPAVRD